MSPTRLSSRQLTILLGLGPPIPFGEPDGSTVWLFFGAIGAVFLHWGSPLVAPRRAAILAAAGEPSCCGCGLLIAQREPAQIIGGSLGLACCCEEGPFVGLQEPNPRRDITGMPQVAVQT